MKISQHVVNIANMAKDAGGRALLVGGAVVDICQGREPKDWDVEVYAIPMQKLEMLLVLANYSPNRAGAKFGILKLNQHCTDGQDIDVSVPRRDNKVGKGHADFEATLDINMDPEDAALRRDFTINSLALDPLTGEIIDPFGGLRDLDAGILRVTHPDTFMEDPIRPLRAMQLSARKCPNIDLGTMDLCRLMADEFENLSKERIFDEFNKLLLQAELPSIGLRFLQESGWLSNFPELQALVGCEQDPDWHPEGDAWDHTCVVLDNAAAYARDAMPEDWRLAFMYGALLHDLGKPATTLGRWIGRNGAELTDFTSIGHDTAGEAPARAFMERLTNQKDLIEKVVAVVVNHMQPRSLNAGGAKESAWKRLHNKLPLKIAGYMSLCDGCAHPDKTPETHEHSKVCWEYAEKFGVVKIPAILQGRDLKEAGFKPGPQFKGALAAAYEAQLEGMTDKDELLKGAAAAM